MSVDSLQEKIRKTKNPSVLEVVYLPGNVPPQFLEGCTALEAFCNYARALLTGLKGKLPAVRFSFSSFAVVGPKGLDGLSELMKTASSLGYYVLLDGPEMYSSDVASAVADEIFGAESAFDCDGMVISGYMGSDIWKAFVPYCAKAKKDVFVAVRTGNKSAPELQDLLAGGRLVHIAAADHVNRSSLDCVGKCGYSRVGILGAASSAESLRSLRGKYPKLFILIDGYDYPNANAKNCAAAFDRLGHGAAVCASASITAAWKQSENGGEDFLEASVASVERMKKNLTRYISVL